MSATAAERLRRELVCATRIWVIPIPEAEASLTPTGNTGSVPPILRGAKRHPRSDPDVVARRMLRDGLGDRRCDGYHDLRLVAVLPPCSGAERTAIYTARIASVPARGRLASPAARPDQAKADQAAPDQAVSDPAMPDQAAPDPAVPDAAGRGVAMAALPDIRPGWARRAGVSGLG